MATQLMIASMARHIVIIVDMPGHYWLNFTGAAVSQINRQYNCVVLPGVCEQQLQTHAFTLLAKIIFEEHRHKQQPYLARLK